MLRVFTDLFLHTKKPFLVQGRERTSLVVPPCFDQCRLILTIAITGMPVEIAVARQRFLSRLTGDLRRFYSEEDLQPLIFPLLRITAPTPPAQCQYEFVSSLV